LLKGFKQGMNGRNGTNTMKGINNKQKVWIFCWILLMSIAMIWITRHPEQMQFKLDNVVLIGNQTLYANTTCLKDMMQREYGCVFYNYIEPPLAYKFYTFQNKFGWYIQVSAFFLLAVVLWRSRKWIKEKLANL
jgi:hypothetical protein